MESKSEARSPTDTLVKHFGSLTPVDVDFTNVSYSTPETRQSLFSTSRTPAVDILHSISGHVRAGESLAILGPSGAGKTTFLNVLAARSQYAPTGQISFNGSPRLPRTKRQIGYVMQDDVFFPNLSVREVLQFTADVRLSGVLSSNQRKQRVEHAIRTLKLTKCADTCVGDQQFHKGISGGERKRLNIANELLHRPSLFLADECTSGLDSSSAFTVINLLRSLCMQMCTVVATIHQPSSQMFSLFSNVMFLAEGSVVYFGPPAAVVQYFSALGYDFPISAHNPADCVMEVISAGGENLAGQFDVSDEEEEEVQKRYRATVQHVTREWRKREERGCEDSNGRDTDDVTVSNDDRSIVVDLQSNERQTMQPPTDVDICQATSAQNATTTQEQSNRALKTTNIQPPTTVIARMGRASRKRSYEIFGSRENEGEVNKYTASWWTQVRVLSRRSMRQNRGVILEPPTIFQATLVCVISILFWFRIDATEDTIEDRLGYISFSTVYWTFNSSFIAIHAFPQERDVLNKDRAAGTYRLSAYYFAKTMVELSADLIIPFISAAITYYGVGLNPDIRAFALAIFIALLNSNLSQGVGIVFAAVFMDIRYAQVGAMAFTLTSLTSSGYYIAQDNIPRFLEPIKYISTIKVSYSTCCEHEASSVYSSL